MDRSARDGSTRAAWRAGSQLAALATTITTTPIAAVINVALDSLGGETGIETGDDGAGFHSARGDLFEEALGLP